MCKQKTYILQTFRANVIWMFGKEKKNSSNAFFSVKKSVHNTKKYEKEMKCQQPI